jgi:hypothetical protein
MDEFEDRVSPASSIASSNDIKAFKKRSSSGGGLRSLSRIFGKKTNKSNEQFNRLK